MNELMQSVDQYFESHLLQKDELNQALAFSLANCISAGLPDIAVSPLQGKLLAQLAKIKGAERILEIGTLGGYSSICMASALPPHGKLISLELDPAYAEIAEQNTKHAGLEELITIRVGEALDSLDRLIKEKIMPFDMVFIDADKPNNSNYLNLSLRLLKPNGIIIVDNVVRNGEVTNPNSNDQSVIGVQALTELVGSNHDLSATVIKTAGRKGYDGLMLIQT